MFCIIYPLTLLSDAVNELVNVNKNYINNCLNRIQLYKTKNEERILGIIFSILQSDHKRRTKVDAYYTAKICLFGVSVGFIPITTYDSLIIYIMDLKYFTLNAI